MSAAAAFYCVADSRYFPGAVGLVNSLRLVGHREPILVLDTGLTDAQRALLEPQAEIVPSPSDAPPWLLKTVAPLARPAAVMVLLDADLVVTRPLTDLIEAPRAGGWWRFATRSTGSCRNGASCSTSGRRGGATT